MTMPMNPRPGAAARLALPALVAGAVILGVSPILVRLADVGPTASAFHRVFLALPALFLWWALSRRRGGASSSAREGTPGHDRRTVGGLILAGLFFAGDLAFWHTSLWHTSVANATLLANFAPVFVALGAFVAFGVRFSRRFLVGMALALAGACLLFGRSFALGADRLFGDLLGLTTGMFFGLYLLTVGRMRARVATVTLMLASTAVTTVVLFPIALAAGGTLIPASARGWAVLFGLALLVHVGGQGLIAFALAHLPAAFSSVGLLIEPTVAALIAWGLFGEALAPLQLVGAAVILAGIMLCRERPQPPAG